MVLHHTGVPEKKGRVKWWGGHDGVAAEQSPKGGDIVFF